MKQRRKIVMKKQIVFLMTIISALVAIALLSSAAIEAQTKRTSKSNKLFSVPCAKALRIGLDEVEDLHDRDQQRRYGNQTTSGMEGTANQNAQQNYISCRRADTAIRLKTLTDVEKTQIHLMSKNFHRLAQMRLDLNYVIEYDEKSEDPINYAVTYDAIALVEDYKRTLTTAYKQKNDPNFVQNKQAAERDEKQIGELLVRIEKQSEEYDKATEFLAFKKGIDKTLKKIEDVAGTERVVTTAFLIRLLKMNLPIEN